MKRMLTQTLRPIILLGLLFINASLFAQIDLELQLNQSIADPGAWKTYTVTAELINKGNVTASNISVSIPKVNGTVYQGGSEYTSTTGTFSPYGNQRWQIPSLGANQSATLTINLFSTSTGIGATYAQVMQASPNDVDSTPGNGTPPSINEDDEALSIGGGNPGGNEKPDLDLAGLSVVTSGTQGSLVNYNIDLKNIGTATAAGDFKIKVFLSPTPGTSGGTTEVGVINTGNIGIGTIPNVPGAFSIPANYPAGPAYLVFFVDADNVVVESNENNNKLSRAFTVTEGGNNGGDFCGFENEYFQLVEDPHIFNSLPVQANETNDGYFFKVTEEVGFFEFEYRDLLINTDGDQISLDQNAAPPVAQPAAGLNGGRQENEVLGNNDVRIKVFDANDNQVFDRTFVNLTSDPNAVINPRVIIRDGGYYLFGNWRNQSNGLVSIYLAELSSNGTLLDYYELGLSVDSFGLGYVDILDDNDVIFTLDNNSSRSIDLLRLNIDGIVWRKAITGDLVSNRVPQITYFAPENAIYLLVYEDPWSEIRKVDESSGNTIWETRLTDAFNPNSTETRLRNRTSKMIVTKDGGTVVAYPFDNPSSNVDGVEIGELDRNGNMVWWRGFSDEYNLTARFQTNDDGYIFTGSKNDQFTVLKLNGAGQPSPNCGGPTGGGAIDLSLDFEQPNITPGIWSSFSSILTVRNGGPEAATNVTIQLNRPDGLVYQGGNEFNASKGNFKPYGNQVWSIGNLAANSSATLRLNYFLTTNNGIEVFAEVASVTEEDGDSTPNNGTPGSASEDDEASLSINGSADRQISLEHNQQRPFIIRNVFPNPATRGQVNLIISSAVEGATEIHIYNSSGQLVTTESIATKRGLNQVNLNIEELSSGLYIARIMGTHSKAATQKFFVEQL